MVERLKYMLSSYANGLEILIYKINFVLEINIQYTPYSINI